MNNDELTSVWQGSAATMANVLNQIVERFGEQAGSIYDPSKNCFTYNRWLKEGYQVMKGQKALKSITWVKSKDGETKYPKTVNLFFISQVEKIAK